jgi:hypothetical protein
VTGESGHRWSARPEPGASDAEMTRESGRRWRAGGPSRPETSGRPVAALGPYNQHEIGDLGQAIELLRRSFLAAMKRLRAK